MSKETKYKAIPVRKGSRANWPSRLPMLPVDDENTSLQNVIDLIFCHGFGLIMNPSEQSDAVNGHYVLLQGSDSMIPESTWQRFVEESSDMIKRGKTGAAVSAIWNMAAQWANNHVSEQYARGFQDGEKRAGEAEIKSAMTPNDKRATSVKIQGDTRNGGAAQKAARLALRLKENPRVQVSNREALATAKFAFPAVKPATIRKRFNENWRKLKKQVDEDSSPLS